MTIYIRPDGTISGSNEPLPVKPKDFAEQLYYDQAIAAWKESCIDFEQDGIEKKTLLEKIGGYYAHDTIIENVDVETEEIKQWRLEDEEWKDGEPEKMWGNTLPTRTVLRIKDKP